MSHWGVLGVHISLEKFQLDIRSIKGVHQKGFLFILVGTIVWFIFLVQYVIPWSQFWLLDVLIHVFCANSVALLNSKRGIGYI